MKLRIRNVRIALKREVTIAAAIAAKLGVATDAVGHVQVERRAVDARNKQDVRLNYHVLADVDLPKGALRRLRAKSVDILPYQPVTPVAPVLGSVPLTERPVVIGAGPGGLLAALELAKYGYCPLLLERGKALARRVADVERFWRTGALDPASNVQFGEGGAGTFSDGKLTTRVNDPVMVDILQAFVDAGAPPEILYEHKPHVGTDRLRGMVAGLTRQIRELGGEIRYETQVTDFFVTDGKLTALELNGSERLPVQAVVLAPGHSARDTYAALVRRGVQVEAKAFAIGLRVEHPQHLIDVAQYGSFAGHPLLGPADYALVYHTPDKQRAAYSFCMCPGGQVVAAASEMGGVVVNGMSAYDRGSGIANSALVVNVTPQDFGTDPLAGIAFQRRYEQLAFAAAGSSYHAPAQSVQSYLDGAPASLAAEVTASYRPGVVAAELSALLPDYVTDTLKLGIAYFGTRVCGFSGPAGLLTGVETRTSSPLRVLRGDDYQAVRTRGLYPCGEGAGYAGGIMSAALDGYHVARAIMARFAPIR